MGCQPRCHCYARSSVVVRRDRVILCRCLCFVAGTDFDLMDALSLPSLSLDGATTCTPLIIVDDAAFEADESLTIQIIPVTASLIIPSLGATVIILDNDGKTTIDSNSVRVCVGGFVRKIKSKIKV